MQELMGILADIGASHDSQDLDLLSQLKLKLAHNMATSFSLEIAEVERLYSAKYIEIKNARRESGFKTTADELEEARGETDIAKRKVELYRLWKGCEECLKALQARIMVLTDERKFQHKYLGEDV